MKKINLLNQILVEDENGSSYIIIQNKHKSWYIPVSNFELGLEIFQPTSVKGKLIKKIMPFIVNYKLIKKLTRVKEKKYILEPQLELYLKNKLGSNILLSVYIGDTRTIENRKATLQIYNDEIICYGKVTSENLVKQSFKREISSLQKLRSMGITNIPIILETKNYLDLDLFLQSNMNIRGNTICTEITEKHLDFLDKIFNVTQCKCEYKDTDFKILIEYLKNIEISFDNRNLILDSISYIERELNSKKKLYSFSHGDFTPWNIYYNHKNIYVFDFEYCLEKNIPYIDVFHYITQVWILVEKLQYKKLWIKYQETKKILNNYVENPDFTYLCYILYIIAFYYKRNNGKFSESDNSFKYWIVILEKLRTELKY